MSYIEEQKAFLKLCPVGSRVKVVRSAKQSEEGWNNSWEEPMDSFIGEEGVIIEGGRAGLVIEKDYDSYDFPYFVLEPIIPEKWCIRQDRKEVNDWANEITKSTTYVDTSGESLFHYPSIANGHYLSGSIQKGYTEISFEFFEKYILNKSKTQTMQKITRKNLEILYNNVCQGWREAIDDIVKEQPFSDEIEIDEETLNTAFSEADTSQKELLNKFFKIEPAFDSSMLSRGEMMYYGNKVVLRTFSGFVDINDPSSTWQSGATLEGKKVPSGKVFTIIAR